MTFFFAWVATGTTTFGVAHHVFDPDVISGVIEHVEGDFASLTIELKNPHVGLLNATRKQWVWFSWKRPDDVVVPLFHGRLVAIPEDIDKEVVTLEFTARPEDYEEQKRVLAESLKVLPFYDPVFMPDDADVDAVLEGRSQLWHIGRTDKLVTVSDILVPEDGQLLFDEDDVLEESLAISYGQEPIRHVHVEATASWQQFAHGTVNLTKALVAAFVEVGSQSPNISSYTGGGPAGLEATWPKFGQPIGGGWSVHQSSLRLLSGETIPGDFIRTDINPALAVPGEGDIQIEDWWETSPEGYDYWYNLAVEKWLAEQKTKPHTEGHFYRWVFNPQFHVQYDATRGKKEVLSFDVSADIQALVADEEAKTTDITITSDKVGVADATGDIAIGNVSSRSYFNTPRGRQSIDYLLARARAQMLFAARAVEVSFELSFAQAVELSCRKGVLLTLAALPGGQCEGKIIGYSLHAADGEMSASCTIGCSIGKGNALPASDPGVETYVTGYVTGYRYMAGEDISSIAGELTYKNFVLDIDDDGIDFSNMKAATVVTGTAASGLLTFTGAGANGNTITIGGRTYTLVATLTAANQVKIGGNKFVTAHNLVDAINAAEGWAGTTYGVGTVKHVDVRATTENAIVRVTAEVTGVGGNSLAVSRVGTAMSWAASTLDGGDDGLIVTGGETQQAAILNQTYGSVKEAANALNEHPTHVQMALKPVTGGPFETLFSIIVSDLVVPRQIDLEAA